MPDLKISAKNLPEAGITGISDYRREKERAGVTAIGTECTSEEDTKAALMPKIALYVCTTVTPVWLLSFNRSPDSAFLSNTKKTGP